MKKEVRTIDVVYTHNINTETTIQIFYEDGTLACKSFDFRLTATQVALEIMKIDQEYIDIDYFKCQGEYVEPPTIMQEEI